MGLRLHKSTEEGKVELRAKWEMWKRHMGVTNWTRVLLRGEGSILVGIWRMENRIEMVEKRIEELGVSFQTQLREAIRLQTEEMMKMMTDRLEETIGEMRVWRREVEGDTVHRRDSYREEESRREARVKRVEVPFFSGDDPHGWVYRVERYFEVNRVLEAEKGKALNWYQWWESRMVVAALMGRFQVASSENPYEVLMGLRQRGSVLEYREQFELRYAPLHFADEEFMKGVFMNGLKEDIKAEVRLMGSGDLHVLMEVAQKVEERNRVLGRSMGFAGRGSGPGMTRSALPNRWAGPSETKEWAVGPNFSQGGSIHQKQLGGKGENAHSKSPTFSREGSTSSSNRRGMGYKRLTEEEENEKRRRGLCFRCDERYSPGHVCRNKQLHVILLGQEEGVEEDEAPSEKEEGDEVNLQLNVSSIAGMTSKNSLKLWGTIKGNKVIVMVDSGASHNFLSPRVVGELGIQIEETRGYFVEVGNGQRLGSQGVCRNVELQLPTLMVKQDFYLFELVGVDVILGYEWLKSLGKFSADLGKHLLEIQGDGTIIEVRGDPVLSRTVASLKAVMKELRNEGEAYYVELGMMNMWVPSNWDMPISVQQLVEEYADLFQEQRGLPPRRSCDHAIVLKEGAAIPNIRPYRHPHRHKEEIEKFVKNMLEAGMIRPSVSPFSSPLILVKKKNGSWRFCVDYRALNSVTIPNKFPIPVIEELLDELGGAMVFSKLDLKFGYHQVRMKEADIPKTAFRTHEGHYEYLVMPFGLTNALSTFQALMNDVFRPFIRKFVLVFFDDILIYSQDMGTHTSHLQQVFQKMREHELWVNRKKCNFRVKQLEYLGHLISGEGIKADPSKIEAMVAWPEPKDIRSLRGFLGLTGYYRRFVRNYGMIAKPLTQLLKKNGFLWSVEAKSAFNELKSAMTSLPTLAMPDFDLSFVIETDAPPTFISQALSEKAKARSVYERELMAIVLAVQKWRQYLLGHHFIIRTDQKSLRFLLEKRVLTGDQLKWVTKLMGYDFEIQYKPGADNRVADALSRVMTYSSISVITNSDLIELAEELARDEKLRGLMQEVIRDPKTHPTYAVAQGCLWHKGRLVLPQNSTRIPLLLEEFHASPWGGHSGVTRTYKRLAMVFFWKGMRKDIERFVLDCAVCQRHKYQALKPAGLLQPLPIPNKVWEDLSMDFIGGLPKAKGADTIMVVVDRLSKSAHFMPLQHPYSATDVARVFVKEVVRLHGFPRSMVSDRDRVFISLFWKELFRLAGTKLHFSSAYHPQTDGQTEVVNRTVETYLRCFVSGHPKQWVQWLSWAELWFNCSYNASIKMSPFKALYGCDPPTIVPFRQETTVVAAVDQLLASHDTILLELKQNLVKAQLRMREQVDKHRREVEFEVGDMVYLKFQSYKFRSLARKENEKLSPRFYGPFEIEERIGAVAYKLKLPEYSRVHPVFHVSQLKRAPPASIPGQQLPAGLTEEWDARSATTHKWKIEVLIKWVHLPQHDNTWEEFELVKQAFPDFHLEDKVLLVGEGIDGPKVTQIYRRRKSRAEGKVGNVEEAHGCN
ncbi:hypothetical protein V8G54_012975 [Vigna mungo]|uniref:RNA-directed DNA polymerase n=1 Tax=Vigna mungo TaxID=3915 RepID=A0AAQ3S4I0_VIGMU